MHTERLLENLKDQIMEAQLKLGYAKETLRFYYPVSSLNLLLGEKAKSADEMLQILQRTEAFSDSVLGKLHFLVHEDRIEIGVLPEGAEYVHEHVEQPPFLADLIELFRSHHACGIEEVRAVFEKYSDAYVCRRMPEGTDFDYVLYFKDSSVDAWYYCIRAEMGHTVYHRFTREDYELLFHA